MIYHHKKRDRVATQKEDEGRRTGDENKAFVYRLSSIVRSENDFRTLSSQQLLYAGAILLLIVLYFGWRVQRLNHSFNYDEGIHLIWGELWAAGYTPYEEIFLSYPPFFIWSMGVPWQLFRDPAALQLLMATYALAGVLGVIYLGSAFHSRLAGLAAGTLLAFSPAYVTSSIRVMSEVPSVGLAVAGVALAEKYRRHGGRLWLGLAGAVLALSLSLKILPFYAVPFVGFLALLRHLSAQSWPQFKQSLAKSKTQILLDWAIAGSSFALIFVIPFSFFDRSAAYRQVFGMRFDTRAVAFNPYESASRDIIEFLFDNPGLMALTLVGLVFVVARNLKHYWLLLVWLILVWVSMNFHVPLRHKHMPIFLPVMAIFAGLALDHLFNYMKNFFKKRDFNLQTAAMLLLISTLIWLFGADLSRAWEWDNETIEAEPAREEWLAPLEFIQAVTTPQDCVIADNPVFLYFTNRLPPPELAETSSTRIATGHLTLADLTHAADRHHCQAVAVVSPRFAEEIPGLTAWLAANYLGRHQVDGVALYFGKIGTEPDSSASLNSRFGDLITLTGLDLGPQPWTNAAANYISLWWRLEAPLDAGVVEQIIFRRPVSGEIVARLQRPLLEGQFDPAAWAVGAQVRDTFRVSLPAHQPGQVEVYLSLCQNDSGRCLPLSHQPTTTELLLGQLQVAHERR